MAADKEIMKALETLRLDRPGRTYAAGDVAVEQNLDFGFGLVAALRELAATYREEAGLWARSGARGWKSSETEAFLIAQAIDDVAAQLDNAGGGAALSVSNHDGRLDDVEQALHESAKRIDGVRDLAGLDALIADSVAQRKGMVRDELLPDGHPARGDNWPREADGSPSPGTADDVTAYLKGETNDIPGSAPLAPNSITSAPEADDPFAGPATLRDEAERLAADPIDRVAVAEIQEDMEHLRPTVPPTWESETMTADGHLLPGVARTAAPLLGQPGDAGAGYSHAYVPAGGRRFTYAELLTPVPAASLPPHLSHSQGNTIGDCATKYRLQRVEQLPQVPQWANVGGSAFHAAVEAIEREEVLTPGSCAGNRWDVEVMWKINFENEINAVAATSPVPVSVWRASRKGAEGRQWWEVNGPLMLRRYLDARPDTDTARFGGTDAIEIDVTVDVPTPYGPLPFNAKIDRVTIDRVGGRFVVRDYKTSYERPTDTTQLGDYANVLRLAYGIPDYTQILGTYFDARRGTWTEPVDLLDVHPFEAFQYRVTTAYAQRLALTTGPTPARPSSFCGGCSVRYACPIMASKS